MVLKEKEPHTCIHLPFAVLVNQPQVQLFLLHNIRLEKQLTNLVSHLIIENISGEGYKDIRLQMCHVTMQRN